MDREAESGASELRKIVHIDMDAFFASVEIRDDPKLRGKPVIVGGMPGTRGVVCTCSYEARKYGVHSAMSATRARELCPHGIFLKPRFEAYSAVSKQIRRIFADYTDLVEPVSLDEAYLDVTENKRGIPYAYRTAREIRSRIFRETGGLTASAGVSFNMFLAKIASDLRKPDALTVILPEYADRLLASLPVGKFYGIGRVTEKRLNELGIRTGGDLKALSLDFLQHEFGKAGSFYYGIVRGIDPRRVTPVWERKSLGAEETFESDVSDLVFLYEVLRKQAEDISLELRKRRLAGRTVTLKIRYFDFRTVTRSRTGTEYLDDAEQIADNLRVLLLASEAGKIPVRLIGASVSRFPEQDRKKAEYFGSWIQPDLFSDPEGEKQF